MHDANTLRITGKDALITEQTLAELKSLDAGSHKGAEFAGEQIPTLLEILQMVKAIRPTLRLGVEIKDYREEAVDKAVALLKEYGFFDDCWFYCFNARIIRYIKTAYGGRTMGYPDFQMREFEPRFVQVLRRDRTQHEHCEERDLSDLQGKEYAHAYVLRRYRGGRKALH